MSFRQRPMPPSASAVLASALEMHGMPHQAALDAAIDALFMLQLSGYRVTLQPSHCPDLRIPEAPQ